KLTRSWSLSYYDELYDRFGTTFDELFFESNIADRGVEIVNNNIGTVFIKDDGAVIFDGEKYGLHTRVFITKEGYPTYEAKDIGLAPVQYKSFSFDKNIHVVGDEQSGYFQVVFKAMSFLYPDIADKEYHLPMGMVNLKGLKMSSRTGVIITVDGLLQEIKQELRELVGQTGLEADEQEDMLEKVTLGAVKYSVLKNDPEKYVLFDLKESINLNGNSGPYIQYTYARCKSLLSKAGDLTLGEVVVNKSLLMEELDVLRLLYRFPEIVEDAAKSYKPNLVCAYIFELSQKFNSFYNAVPILTDNSIESKQFRLALTSAVSQVLKNGLNVLGIQVSERM
ncbi:arginine--tRNA ligase, partial [candidate division WWE3 bacterium]|nr:arginine--tRNA ligase [candidate division WWE3 bacterium]